MSIELLISGYAKFFREYMKPAMEDYRKEAMLGQRPKVMVISCSDARVNPSLVTKTKLGDIFHVANVANIVPPFIPEKGRQHHSTSSALEFAVGTLEVEDVIVMGHSGCGGIDALLNGSPMKFGGEYSFIQPWVGIIANAVKKVQHIKDPAEQHTACEKEGIKISLANLRSFPWVTKRIEEGKLAIHGWHFDIGSGLVTAYDEQSDSFKPLID